MSDVDAGLLLSSDTAGLSYVISKSSSSVMESSTDFFLVILDIDTECVRDDSLVAVVAELFLSLLLISGITIR